VVYRGLCSFGRFRFPLLSGIEEVSTCGRSALLWDLVVNWIVVYLHLIVRIMRNDSFNFIVLLFLLSNLDNIGYFSIKFL
jgi:hypothetical protein